MTKIEKFDAIMDIVDEITKNHRIRPTQALMIAAHRVDPKVYKWMEKNGINNLIEERLPFDKSIEKLKKYLS
jgi:hypothetical protein